MWLDLTWLSHVSLKYSIWPPSVSFSRRPLFRTCHFNVSMVTRHCLSRDTAQPQQRWMNDDLLLCNFSFFIKNIHKCISYSMKHWYSDCQICASGCVLLFKHLYNDRVSWAVYTMGSAILVSLSVQRIGSVGFTASIPPLLTKYMKVSGWWTGRRIGSNVKLLTQCVSDMNKTCRLIIIESIIIAASIDISVYFTNSTSLFC